MAKGPPSLVGDAALESKPGRAADLTRDASGDAGGSTVRCVKRVLGQPYRAVAGTPLEFGLPFRLAEGPNGDAGVWVSTGAAGGGGGGGGGARGGQKGEAVGCYRSCEEVSSFVARELRLSAEVWLDKGHRTFGKMAKATRDPDK